MDIFEHFLIYPLLLFVREIQVNKYDLNSEIYMKHVSIKNNRGNNYQLIFNEEHKRMHL